MTPNRKSIETLLLYLCAKLISAPADEAAKLAASLNLDRLGVASDLPESADDSPQAVAQRLSGGWQALASGAPTDILGAVRPALESFCGLVEKGGYGDAETLADWLIAGMAGGTPWSLSVLLPLFGGSVAALAGQPCPDSIHHAKLAISSVTRGRANEVVAAVESLRRPPLRFGADGMFGGADFVAAATADMQDTGYHHFAKALPADWVHELRHFASVALGHPIDEKQGINLSRSLTLDEVDPALSGLKISKPVLAAHPLVQRLMCDPSLTALARAYLGAEPVLTPPNMWWSFPVPGSPSSELAQMFHYDMDWWKFFKVFIYLTDVDEAAGPHSYVRGTHKVGAKPDSLLQLGYVRLTDQQIAEHHPAADILSVPGAAGTVFSGDTRCWHKGTLPAARPRLLLQLEWAATHVHSGEEAICPIGPDMIADLKTQFERSPFMMQCFRAL